MNIQNRTTDSTAQHSTTEQTDSTAQHSTTEPQTDRTTDRQHNRKKPKNSKTPICETLIKAKCYY